MCFFRYLHAQWDKSPAVCETLQEDGRKTIDDLLALLDEGALDIDMPADENTIVLRQVDLRIKSKKMLPLSKSKLIDQFFDLVSNDLKSLNWEEFNQDNLNKQEWAALNKLKSAKGLNY